MELTLTRQDASSSQVTVDCDGQYSHIFALTTLISHKGHGLPRPIDDPIAYGRALFAVLFPPDSLAHKTFIQKPKRILLVANDDTVDALPWEYVYGPGGFVVCTCSFVRGLPARERIDPPDMLSGLHIVAIVSSPLDHTLLPLNIHGEWTRLTEIVGSLKRAVTLQRAWPPTIACLRDLVAEEPQRVVHFMGHGGQDAQGEAVVCFEQDNGEREDITASEFVSRVQDSVFLVTLNACESATPGEPRFGNLARALVREQVPYALGMRFAVHDDDALAFTRTFYSDLARGVPVEEALRQARLTLVKSERAWAIGVPVLYTALTHAAPGFVTAMGEPDVQDAQEDALHGIIGDALPTVQGAFQGRLDEQIALGNWLTGDRRPRIITIHGSGGQGKTALARIAAERFAHAWPGGVWAFTLETVPNRTIFVASLARFLGLSPQEATDPAELERQVLQRLHRKRTLLVLDNFETLDEAAKAQDAEALSLAEFIQHLPGERTSLLCTSRHVLEWSGEQHLELPGLSPDEGAMLFEQSAPERAEEIDLALARQLSQRVDGHPLGLTLLGRAFNDCPIALTAFLADHERYLLAAENTFIGVEHRQRKMYANFEYSVRWLPSELRDTLSKLWVFHAAFLPHVAVTVLDPEHDTNAADASPVENHLYALWKRGLLTREAIRVGEERVHVYRLPPVMRPYVEQYLADPGEREALLRRFGEASLELAQYVYRALLRGRAIATLALQCYDDLARGVTSAAGVVQGYALLHWGWILHWLGDQQAGVAMTEQALEMAEGQDRTLEVQARHNLAMIIRATGHPHAALRLYEQALVIRREVGDRAGEGTTLNNLGRVYNALGQKPKALDYYEQALVIRREVGDRAGEGTTLNNLGGVYDALGQKPKALDYYEQALVIRREVGDRAGEGTTLNNLGGVYDALGQKPKALDYYEQALVITREVGDRAGEGTTLNNLGRVYNALGQKPKALDYYEQALVIMREVGDRAGEGTTLNNLGYVYDALGQQPKALDYYEQALVITREVGDRAGEAVTFVNMAVLLYQDGQHPQEAIANMEQALLILQVTGLPQDAAGQTTEMIEYALQTMRDGTFSREQSSTASTMPTEHITTIIGNTIAVMTTMQERRSEWREAIAQALQDAKLRGIGWQIKVEFFTAILAILDGESPSLPADHPYAAAIAAIQDGIAHGGFDMDNEDEDAVSEEVQVLAMLVQVSVTALRSTNLQEKMAFIQQLVALQAQAPEDEMKALFQVLQLALLGGDLTHLGDTLTGLARQVWEMIVAGVQQDDTPQHDMPDAE
jgi:tetratricopeptide (TPR) repeat protein